MHIFVHACIEILNLWWEESFQCHVCVWVISQIQWVAGRTHPLPSHWQGLWWMFHVSFTNLCLSIVENQACKIITELKDGGKRENWSIDLHWACLFLFPPRLLCGHYLQKWLLLTFLYAKNSNYIYLWQAGCCNLRTWTTGCLKNFTSLIWMEIEWKCKWEVFSEWHCRKRIYI